jgi:hypothetical protein
MESNSARAFGQLFKILPFSAQKSHSAGGRNPNICVTEEPMQNCKTLRQPLLEELAMSWRERKREEEKKMPFIVATYVYASSQGQRTHSTRTNKV